MLMDVVITTIVQLLCHLLVPLSMLLVPEYTVKQLHGTRRG